MKNLYNDPSEIRSEFTKWSLVANEQIMSQLVNN
jgi:hypothetical protein